MTGEKWASPSSTIVNRTVVVAEVAAEVVGVAKEVDMDGKVGEVGKVDAEEVGKVVAEVVAEVVGKVLAEEVDMALCSRMSASVGAGARWWPVTCGWIHKLPLTLSDQPKLRIFNGLAYLSPSMGIIMCTQDTLLKNES